MSDSKKPDIAPLPKFNYPAFIGAREALFLKNHATCLRLEAFRTLNMHTTPSDYDRALFDKIQAEIRMLEAQAAQTANQYEGAAEFLSRIADM